MEVSVVMHSDPPGRNRERLCSEQKTLWGQMKPHAPRPAGEQTPQQAVNLSVLTFLFWCDFDGVGRAQPTEAAVRAEFVSAGVAELMPDRDFWEDLRRNPRLPWVLAPGSIRLDRLGRRGGE
jgi:hypothetical protein